MKVITKIDAVKLAQGIQQILLTMIKDGVDPRYPIKEFERLIIESKGVSPTEAERVTEKILNTGIIRWELGRNCFVL